MVVVAPEWEYCGALCALRLTSCCSLSLVMVVVYGGKMCVGFFAEFIDLIANFQYALTKYLTEHE